MSLNDKKIIMREYPYLGFAPEDVKEFIKDVIKIVNLRITERDRIDMIKRRAGKGLE